MPDRKQPTPPRLTIGASVETLIVEYWRCEMHNALHFNANQEMWEQLKRAIGAAGIIVRETELPHPWPFFGCDIHRDIEIKRAIFEVQGLKFEEGVSILDALESLIKKYAETR